MGLSPIRTLKLRDRISIALIVSLVLVVILLIINLRMESRSHRYLQELELTQFEQKPIENEIDQSGVFAAKTRKFQFGKYANLKGASPDQIERPNLMSKDKFQDLENTIAELENMANDPAESKPTDQNESSPKMGEFLQLHPNQKLTSLEKFYMEISQNELYPEKSALVDKIIAEMATQPISYVQYQIGGTQMKLKMEYENNILAVFKPKRWSREQQTFPNQLYFTDYERHTAEIATFHLDRILGFRRAMPATGRTLNMTSEIYEVSDSKLQKNCFQSPAPDNNQCFIGDFHRFCDIYHPVCGNKDQLEGSFVAYFPEYEKSLWTSWRHPWRRSYRVNERADWENNLNYCSEVKDTYPFNEGRRILDLMDMAVMDFLTGNMDRHHYQTFEIFGNNAFTIHCDNGRGFGKAFHDEISILAPLTQCCMIRLSTLKTLLSFHNGPKPLSVLMGEAMSIDPISPVLWAPHLEAMDRRVGIILNEVRDCIRKSSIKDVVVTR